MSRRPPLMSLTWAGFDVAVDLIAAQCRRQGRSGVYGLMPPGKVLAIALADRLELNMLDAPAPGMLLVMGCYTGCELLAAAGLEDVEPWAWIDCSSADSCHSVMRVQGSAQLLWPWQEAPSHNSRPFVPGFDD
jgi:hypothetical protein